MIVLAIDPGSAASGFVVYDSCQHASAIIDRGKPSNDALLGALRVGGFFGGVTELAIEMPQSFGAKVWDQVFVTTFWIGRFCEAWSLRGHSYAHVYRRDVKLHITGSPRAKDGQVRQCLLDRWGGKERAIGTKKAPGPLYGIKADCWSALAIAVTYADKHQARQEGAQIAVEEAT